MDALIDDLVQVLSGQLELYGQVRDLLDEEAEALASRKPDVVLDVVRRKENILLRIRTLEESRRLVCVRLAKKLGLPAVELTVSEILKRPEGAKHERLGEVRDALRALVAVLRKASAKNARICTNGMELIAGILESAAGQNPQGPVETYGPNGARTAKTPGRGRPLGVNRMG